MANCFINNLLRVIHVIILVISFKSLKQK